MLQDLCLKSINSIKLPTAIAASSLPVPCSLYPSGCCTPQLEIAAICGAAAQPPDSSSLHPQLRFTPISAQHLLSSVSKTSAWLLLRRPWPDHEGAQYRSTPNSDNSTHKVRADFSPAIAFINIMLYMYLQGYKGVRLCLQL